jgi:hypothetical protein
MTTPETARTAEQAYAEWRSELKAPTPTGTRAEEEIWSQQDRELAAAIAFVRSCLPEPQASKATCPDCRDRGRVDVQDGRGNTVMDKPCPRGCSAPAGEAVSVAREALVEYREWARESGGERFGPERRLCIAIDAALSAPPPSTGDKPQPRWSNQPWPDDARPSQPPTNPYILRTTSFPEMCNVAPTPPPAPASKGEPSAVLEAFRQAWNGASDGKCPEFDIPPPAAPLSVAPAREGFTFPDAAVEKLLSLIDWQNAFVAADFRHHVCQDAAALRAARLSVTTDADAGRTRQ